MSDQNVSEQAAGPQGAAVVVSRTVACPVKQVWKVLMTKEGAEALLGRGAEFGQKGSTWEAEDGRGGVIRSLHPLEQIRFSYRKDALADPTTVELTMAPQGEATVLRLTHSRLDDDLDLEWVRGRWEAAFDRIQEHLAAHCG